MLTFFTREHIDQFVNKRPGETKLGETVAVFNQRISFEEALQELDAQYILFGVPEDIGVKMNGGNGGAHTGFIPGLKAFLNTQQNQFIQGSDIAVLGYLDCLDDVLKFDPKDRALGDRLVKKIDDALADIIRQIIEADKTPIIIGGGHNNAFGNIKGLASAKGNAVNVINMDAHTDLRRLEERHSGNGFSYALDQGYLQKYFMFGLHENYTPQYIFEEIHNNPNLEYNTYEELAITQLASFTNELQRAVDFITNTHYGIELDLDCIEHFPSSAMTPSGFSAREARQFVYNLGKHANASYLHICEGAPAVKNEPTTAGQVGKFISYLVSDFIKARTRMN